MYWICFCQFPVFVGRTFFFMVIGHWGWEERGGTHLGSASGVLGCAAGDEFGVVVLDQIFVEAHVLFFREDGVVGLEPVFLEHGFIPRREEFVISECSAFRPFSSRHSCNGSPFALDVF